VAQPLLEPGHKVVSIGTEGGEGIGQVQKEEGAVHQRLAQDLSGLRVPPVQMAQGQRGHGTLGDDP
jgi:hypothetical protein